MGAYRSSLVYDCHLELRHQRARRHGSKPAVGMLLHHVCFILMSRLKPAWSASRFRAKPAIKTYERDGEEVIS